MWRGTTLIYRVGKGPTRHGDDTLAVWAAWPGGYVRKRLWLVPSAILTAIALLGFGGIYALDVFVTGSGAETSSAWYRYLQFDPEFITDALSGLAAMTAAVLGIVITVVSLLVQLSSERYTGVAQMFLRDRINLAVMSYFIVACVCGVFASVSVHAHFVPRAAILLMVLSTATGLLVMLPYFAYVFRFLEPGNLVERIANQASRDMQSALATAGAEVAAQLPAMRAMEELTDITSNSISGKDKIVASRAVDALAGYVVTYLGHKHAVPPAWFTLGRAVRGTPDFVAMDPESLVGLEDQHTWFEWKALRQLLGVFAEAQATMPDINYLIAIDTRYIAEAALRQGDRPVVELCLRYFNSYLRTALNAKAVRTAYNVLNQYRLLAEHFVRHGDEPGVLAIAKHLLYYGRISFDMQLGFVMETVAYDLAALCEFAAMRDAPELGAKLLGMLLELDQPLRSKREASALQGVRKAQIKLACFYLATELAAEAQRIAQDMRSEAPARLDALVAQLQAVEGKEFWEIIDRGRNFEYMPEAHRRQLAAFQALVEREASSQGA